MKVLIYSEACFSDSTLPLYKAMKAEGIEVTLLFQLLCPNINLFNEEKMIPRTGIFKATEYSSFKRYEKYCDLSDVYVENCYGITQKSIKMLKSTWAVAKFIHDGNYDAIHVDFLLMAWKTPLLCFRKKMTLIQHEAIPHARKLDWMNRLFRAVNYKMIPRIVVLNHAAYDEFCRKYNVNQNRVLVNKLGPLNVISVFAKGSNDNSSNTIVFWGRIVRYKGLEYLCQAMPLVHEAVPEAELIIAGSGDFYFDIEPYQKLSYITIIHKFLDMEALAGIIEKSAFTVCPYVSSSQSGGVIASLAMGKPVIGTNFETMREMIDENVTGLLVPPRNHIELANAIIKLLKDKDLRNRLKENIKNSNKADEEWREIANKYLLFYRKKCD